MENINPNEVLTPVFEGDELIWVTPPEYYARYMGNVCFKKIQEEENE